MIVFFSGVYEFPFDDEFGYRFSTFTDGEGCFTIHYNKIKNGYVCRFTIKLRDDDYILEKFHKGMNVGKIAPMTINHHLHKYKININPQYRLTITNKEDCHFLVKFFERYPLWGKKEQDFAIWAKAVHEWLRHKPGDSWEPMEKLKQELMEVRRYKPKVLEKVLMNESY